MRRPPVNDVVVVGAGPAGIAASLHAHDAGLDVVVVDKATFPRDKTCGDGLTAAALRRLERLGLDITALPSRAVVSEAVLVSPAGRRVRLPMPADGMYGAGGPRAARGAPLGALARRRGVDVREATPVAAVEPDPEDDRGPVTVRLDDGEELLARWVVAADGHYSRTRRAV